MWGLANPKARGEGLRAVVLTLGACFKPESSDGEKV